MGTCTSAEHTNDDNAGTRRRRQRSLSRRKSTARDTDKRRAARGSDSQRRSYRGKDKAQPRDEALSNAKMDEEEPAGSIPSPQAQRGSPSPAALASPQATTAADRGAFTSLSAPAHLSPSPHASPAVNVASERSGSPPARSLAPTETPQMADPNDGQEGSGSSPPAPSSSSSSSDGLPNLNSDDDDDANDADGVPRPSSSVATMNPLAPPLLSDIGRAPSEAGTGSVVDSDSGIELSTSRVVIADIKGSPTVAAFGDTSRLRRQSAAFSENSSSAARTQSPWSFVPRNSLGGSTGGGPALGLARNSSVATDHSTPTNNNGQSGPSFTTTTTALRRFTSPGAAAHTHRPSTVGGMSSFAAEDTAPASDDLSMLMVD